MAFSQPGRYSRDGEFGEERACEIPGLSRVEMSDGLSERQGNPSQKGSRR
jgi:hypothetical protein